MNARCAIRVCRAATRRQRCCRGARVPYATFGRSLATPALSILLRRSAPREDWTETGWTRRS
eukprot:1759214-Pleurochrysis_carterae.AAC.1